ncbi:MAG: hypothetical protein ACKD6N_07635 [Candidatus Bathyarchaeota archaeon]
MQKSLLDATLAPFYCRLALTLCQHARELLYDDRKYQSASNICKFISTLCGRSCFSQCVEESKLCGEVSELCGSSEKVNEARRICEVARRRCPKSFSIKAG